MTGDVSEPRSHPGQHPRLRVACYVTRPISHREPQLLVFDHADFPESGTQVPAGGVIGDETFRQAAVREVQEETGLRAVTFVRLLGWSHRAHPEDGSPRLTMYVHLTATGDSPGHWRHVVTGRGEDNSLRFVCRWVALPVELTDRQDELTHRLYEPTGTERQNQLDRDIRRALVADDRVVAALAYGSRMTGEDDCYSDVEYWIVARADWDLATWLGRVETPLAMSRNQFGSDVVIWRGLVRGEFHVIVPDELRLIAAWPQRGASADRMVIKDDDEHRLIQTLRSLPEQQPRPQTSEEVAEVCGRFANWWLMGWNLTLRGEQERSALVTGLARESLLSMARLRYDATDHWLSQASKFELEAPAHIVATLHLTRHDDHVGLWRLGRRLWVDLAAQYGSMLPTRLFQEIDEVVRVAVAGSLSTATLSTLCGPGGGGR